MSKTKSRRLPFVIAIILAVLSIAVVAVATLAGWIEADAVKGEFHFGTIAAIKEESGSWRWACFTAVYTTLLAWMVSAVVYQIGSLLFAS